MEGLLEAFVTLFVIMDPIGQVPIFISLTKGMPLVEIRKNVDNSVMVAGVLLFVFLFFGLKIFDFFNINLNSFQIAGGIILFIMGISYVLGISYKTTKPHSHDISIPIGIPLLTGPGVITTIIIIVKDEGVFTAVIASLLALLITWVILVNSLRLYRTFGDHWINVISKVMGIILVAIAVEFITKGVLNIITPLLQ